MVKDENLKVYLTREIEGVGEDTFMYQLHERGFFDRSGFQRLISAADKLAGLDDWIEDYNVLLCGVADSFLFIMSLLYYHLDPNDAYVIENYSDIKNEAPGYMDNMRDVLRKMILYW